MYSQDELEQIYGEYPELFSAAASSNWGLYRCDYGNGVVKYKRLSVDRSRDLGKAIEVVEVKMRLSLVYSVSTGYKKGFEEFASQFK